ncbi:MAG: hypothetical protein VB111_05465 [Clostridiaceae bacterium]|nr:hypothetical protein [Clostridiaceae bacterium]
MNKMNVIACTGDSHTWGQGAAYVRALYEAWGRLSSAASIV